MFQKNNWLLISLYAISYGEALGLGWKNRTSDPWSQTTSFTTKLIRGNWLRIWDSNPASHWLTVKSVHLARILRNKILNNWQLKRASIVICTIHLFIQGRPGLGTSLQLINQRLYFCTEVLRLSLLYYIFGWPATWYSVFLLLTLNCHVFKIYGRGTENRTLIIWLKARYFSR